MTLSEAFTALATAGCRLTAAPGGGIELVVPDGAEVARHVLDVLAAHREELGRSMQAEPPPEPRAADLADYLESRGITGASATFVMHAARLFDVRVDSITIEGEATAAEPIFFEPGIPAITTVDTRPVPTVGGTSVLIPAGTLGLLVPQTWAIHDQRHRAIVESIQGVMRRRHDRPHVPFWHDGEAKLVDATHITFEGAVAPAGMNLLPWRPQDAGAH
jgi:hypothetical protein